MFRTNKAFADTKIFRLCILLCIGVCLLFSLTPLTDFDSDGVLDSFTTDGLILNFAAFAIAAPIFLFCRILTARVTSPKLFSSLIVPPPIF